MVSNFRLPFSAAVVVGLRLSGVAVPVVSGVQLSQPSSNRLYIDYALSEPAVVTFDVFTNGVSIGSELLNTFEGDCRVVVASGGKRRISWRPVDFWPDHESAKMTAVVRAWPTNSPPDYMVIDMTGTNTCPNVQWYEKESDLPGGTVLQDVYKTTKLVMRRIHAKGVRWRMGKMAWETTDGFSNYQAPHDVVLSNDYYLAVFELTQRQYLYAKGTDSWNFAFPGHDKNPAENFSYDGCRGSPVTYNFVTMGHTVPDGFFTTLRTMANGMCIDFPTSAQWEFACRAGTRTQFSNGSNDSCRDIAWTSSNWSDDTSLSANMTHEVGLLKPNAFGLYDTEGNVWELCVDRSVSCAADPDSYYVEEEPIGPSSTADNHIYRCGGAYVHSDNLARAASRINTGSGYQNGMMGTRLWCACEAK